MDLWIPTAWRAGLHRVHSPDERRAKCATIWTLKSASDAEARQGEPSRELWARLSREPHARP
jgi:hypothetical protein